MAINYVRSWSAPDKTGKRVWETAIANPKLGESTPAAPIAWNGLVFIGNAGGDNRGVKGRITMSCEATHQNVDVVRVPESELLALIGEARQAFAERCEAGA